MAAHGRARNGSAAVLAVLLMGLALAAAWWAVAPGILGTSPGEVLNGALAPAGVVVPDEVALAEGARISTRLQTSQPRDPFVPLITDTPPVDTDGDGEPDSTVVDRTRFTLEDVSDIAGVLRAEVSVDGVTYTVGIGDTFAGKFKVISLDETAGSGVFSYGDNTFSAIIGQAILK